MHIFHLPDEHGGPKNTSGWKSSCAFTAAASADLELQSELYHLTL